MVWFLTDLVNENSTNIYEIPYQCTSNSNCHSIRSIFPRGEYKFELWGAQGGSTNTSNGGNGGKAL